MRRAKRALPGRTYRSKRCTLSDMTSSANAMFFTSWIWTAAFIWDSNQALRFGNGDIAGATTFTEWARFTNAGRLGIGTTAPDSPLTVNGNASKPGGGSWNVFSDIRLKNVKGKFNTGLNA